MWINSVKGAETSLEQQEQPPRRFVLLGHNIGDLDHRACRDHTIEVLAKRRERLDYRDLGDRVEVLPLIEHEFHMGEGLQPPTESTLRLANTFRNRSQLPSIGADQDNNLVRLTERIRPEHDPRVVVERHEPQGTAALPSSWGATARPETLDTRLETLGPVSCLASVSEPHPVEGRFSSLPVLFNLDPEVEEHRDAEEALEFPAGLGSDGLDQLAAFPDDHPLLRLTLDVDRCRNEERSVLALLDVANDDRE